MIHAEGHLVPMRLLSRIFVCSLATAQFLAVFSMAAQMNTPPASRQMGADETRKANAVVTVSSATQKLELLTEFLASRPNSPMRGRLISHVGIAISRELDAAVGVALAEKFIDLMSTERERYFASGILAEAYLQANRVDDAFQTVALLPSPESLDLRLLARMVSAGVAETRQRNLKHLIVSGRYGEMAIRAIEADLRPAAMTEPAWADYKGKTLPYLYQSLGLLAMHAGQPADAKTRLRTAIELAPDDPLNYIFLGAAMNAEYSAGAEQLKQLRPGPERDALGKKTIDLLSQAVDAYAHGLGLLAGSSQEQTIREQVGPDLESFYKFLHNGSLDGLQALIDSYKKK